MVKISYQQKPYRRILMETYGAKVFASPTDRTQVGRGILAQDPNSPGSLGIAISEAVEVAATSGGAKKYGIGSVLNHVILHQTVVGEEALKHVGFAFNHYIDIEVDRLMASTNKRPLPSGSISKRNALLYIVLVFLLGCFLTLYFYGVLLLLLYLLGILLALLYDVYSKRITGMDFILAASVVVGVLFGAASVSFSFTPLIGILCVLAFLQTLNLNRHRRRNERCRSRLPD